MITIPFKVVVRVNQTLNCLVTQQSRRQQQHRILPRSLHQGNNQDIFNQLVVSKIHHQVDLKYLPHLPNHLDNLMRYWRGMRT
jgi:hypothetical protein